MKRLSLISGFLVVASFASAQGIPGSAGFNILVLGNASTQGGHTEGSAAVLGNWSMNQHELPQTGGSFAPTVGSATNIGIYVGGNVSTNGNAKIQNGRNAYIAGALTGGLIFNGGGSLGALTPTAATTFFNQARNTMEAYSDAIAALPGVNISVSDPNNININLATIPGNLKVINIQASNISQLGTINFSGGNGNETVLVNVRGANITWNRSVNYSGGAGMSRLLWNFPDATTLRVDQRDLSGGGILAPRATLNQFRNVQGSTVVKDWNLFNSVEVHTGNEFVFDGDLSTVPEPASMTALALGAAALLRRKKAKKA